MRITLKRAAAALLISAGLAAGAAAPAGAAADPAKGQDTKFDPFFIGGSDTTYEVENRLAVLYNSSPGCATNNSSSAVTDDLDYPINGSTSGNKATCANAAADSRHNHDHDIAVNIYPTGSGAGTTSVIGGQWHMGRSSAKPDAGQMANVNALGFAKDGVAVVTTGGAVGNLTKAKLEDIYNCAGTHSDAFGNSGLFTIAELLGSGADNRLVYPYGMNTSSGTYRTFNDYIAPDPSPLSGIGLNCVQPVDDSAPLTAGKYAFENDIKPVNAHMTSNGYTANGVALWWASVGVFNTYSYKRGTAAYWNVEGVAPDPTGIADNSYPINRVLYRVIKKGVFELDPAAPATMNGPNEVIQTTGTATTGQLGAARGFAQWACQPTAYFTPAQTNPFNNRSYFLEIGSAITNEGFLRIPSTQRDVGACTYETS